MNYIANIITESKLGISWPFNVVKWDEDLISGIPTLIVGYDKAKYYFENLNILDSKIDSTTYWSFGPRERRDSYENVKSKFIELSYAFVKNKFSYKFINVLIENENFNILEFINGKKCTIYTSKDILYIYFEGENTIYGISLNDYEYLGGQRNELRNKFLEIEGSKNIVYSDVKEFYATKPLKNCDYLIPYLFS